MSFIALRPSRKLIWIRNAKCDMYGCQALATEYSCLRLAWAAFQQDMAHARHIIGQIFRLIPLLSHELRPFVLRMTQRRTRRRPRLLVRAPSLPHAPRRGRARACSSLLLTIFSLRRIPVNLSAPAVSRFICEVGDADASNRLSALRSVNSFHQTLLSLVAVICSFGVN